ncbi:MAG TPA: hypothetical protein VK927_08105, partial [Adhaeribacter sp.]|nr:hypothetical protein [Adhaeribacter sp.]
MKKNLTDLYWHPFLVGLFPVLFLFAHNLAYVPPRDVALPVVAVLLFTALTFGFFRLLLQNNAKAAIITSAALILFFTYGAVYSFLQNAPVALLQKHSFLLAADLLLLLALFWFLRVHSQTPKQLNRISNVFATILILLPVTQVLIGFFTGKLTSDISTADLSEPEWQTSLAPDQRPDILYIILDGYGRQDVLQKYYALNNQNFLDSLRQEGFQVSPQSTSNYCRTVASVASTLNLDYIQNLAPKLPDFCFADLEEMIEDAALLKFLVKQNYYLYGFASGYGHTELTRHVNLIKPYKTLPPFHYMVLHKTPYILIEENGFLNEKYNQLRKLFLKDPEPYFVYRDSHRDMILYSLNHLHDFIGRPEPAFVFADVFVGHPPFIFDRHGNYIPTADSNPLADG